MRSSPPTPSQIQTIVALSRQYGADPRFVLAGGGNTSVKGAQRMLVKGSGSALSSITPDGFVEMDRAALERLLNSELHPDRNRREELFKQAVMAARVAPEKGQRPSVEALLHHLMPRTYVVHTHATLVNAFSCCESGERLVREALGADAIWIADVDPGIVLAQTIRDALKDYAKKTGRDCPRAIILQNHGLVVAADDPDELRANTQWAMERLAARLNSAPSPARSASHSALPSPTSGRGSEEAKLLINTIGPALRGLLSSEDALKVVTFDDSPLVLSLVNHPQGKSIAEGGPLMPDQIVYCKALPLWFGPAEKTGAQLVESLRGAVADYQSRAKYPPAVILVEGLGMFTAGDDFAAADTARQVYSDAIQVMDGARRLGGIRYMPPSQREFFENWEVEQFRRKVAKGAQNPGQATGKVALVTGAAQGFGLEIAQDLASQGAHVILTDVNESGTRAAADAICAKCGSGRAIGLAINVIDGASVATAVHQMVRKFGGLDVLVSNAGVLKAGSVKTQSEKDFDFVTAVNYKGYFVCVQHVAAIMATQHVARPDCWSDIIQINSKSGLQGSNRNGAYAGSKFGGIGLTQSFALELVEDGIKVNSICPGNFFDGPLWSDPNNGLFVQYLRSGKVPGAKTIADVKKFYEAKVPMGRGCITPDVMKAIYYLIEQKYETGQAVPVTGGQVMLS